MLHGMEQYFLLKQAVLLKQMWRDRVPCGVHSSLGLSPVKVLLDLTRSLGIPNASLVPTPLLSGSLAPVPEGIESHPLLKC